MLASASFIRSMEKKLHARSERERGRWVRNTVAVMVVFLMRVNV